MDKVQGDKNIHKINYILTDTIASRKNILRVYEMKYS